MSSGKLRLVEDGQLRRVWLSSGKVAYGKLGQSCQVMARFVRARQNKVRSGLSC